MNCRIFLKRSFLLVVAFSVLSEEVDAQKKRFVLAIGIDGLRTDALDVANTPNIDRLKANGAYSNTAQILGKRYQKNDTISGPGWTSYLTGVWADKHGVHDNGFSGQRIDQFPHFFALLKQQKPGFKTASFIDWHPIDRYIVSKADIRSGHNASGADGYTIFDKHIAEESAEVLKTDNVRATMVYFGACDETGHRDGFHPSVPSYIKAIETVDSHVGKLLKSIESRPNYENEDWLILISSDHGGQGTGHGKGHNVPPIRNVYLIVSGESVKKGQFEETVYIVDLSATALVHLGVKLDPKWQLDGVAVGLKE
ncbi:MAG: alkaline phosphatase family protein [Pirellulales bacterium]|nr:alkaline phosphatase family protein [Pirellulales bacterium]